MKKMFSFLVVIVFLFACNSKSEKEKTEITGTSDTTKTIPPIAPDTTTPPNLKPSTTTQGRMQTGNADLVETFWKLVELRGKPTPPTPQDRKEVHMILKIELNKVNGFAGCNNFNGTYSLEGDTRIKFSQMVTTKMACLDNFMDTETQFLQVLNQADSYYIRGDTLQLIKARMAPLARFVAVYMR